VRTRWFRVGPDGEKSEERDEESGFHERAETQAQGSSCRLS
jgi:hypothetical protein